jgi:26S proteasome regulatory subunit RPN5 C-terminal domain
VPCLHSAGIVRFSKPGAVAEVLNGWSKNISSLLNLLDKATQQIQKELMVHRVPIGAT